jgi:SAM-dependent methyltransferase
MAIFELEPYDPCPLSKSGVLDRSAQGGSQVLALNIESKYRFVNEAGEAYHEYPVPGTPDVQNCGGYVDKVIQYRDPALATYLAESGVSAASFATRRFPILDTRSPTLDLLLFAVMRELREREPGRRVSLLDHGCTVAEHYDLLDVMLQAESKGRDHAMQCLDYCGLDKSAMLLTIARLLHFEVPEDQFRLVLAEGSNFSFPPRAFDLSMSVGVVNHVVNPREALNKILAATRHASVMALWATADEEGYWAINHSGVSFYFFSQSDLAAALARRGEGRFYSAGYTPEAQVSQPRSYIGLGEDQMERLGCYHLVYSTLPELPFKADPLVP